MTIPKRLAALDSCRPFATGLKAGRAARAQSSVRRSGGGGKRSRGSQRLCPANRATIASQRHRHRTRNPDRTALPARSWEGVRTKSLQWSISWLIYRYLGLKFISASSPGDAASERAAESSSSSRRPSSIGPIASTTAGASGYDRRYARMGAVDYCRPFGAVGSETLARNHLFG